MKDFWLYVPDEDEAGCVASGKTVAEALAAAKEFGWSPKPGTEVHFYVLTNGGCLIVSEK